MKLSGKTILLTGATGGIGRSLAMALAEEGVRLILTGRDENGLVQLLKQLDGSDHQLFVADLIIARDRQKLCLLAKREGVDLLINNAGINQLALLTEIKDDDLLRIIEINLTGPILLCKELVPVLLEREESAIVNVGSILGSIGYPGTTAYCASKFGLRGFSEALRRELADTPLQVIYFAPRATDTNLNSDRMVAMNKALGMAVDSPEKVANSLVATLKRARVGNRYLGWPEKAFVRLNSLFPGLVDRAMLKQLPIIRHFAVNK